MSRFRIAVLIGIAMLSMSIGGYLSLSGGRLSGGLFGPYAAFGVVDAGFIICNGHPCSFGGDGGSGGLFSVGATAPLVSDGGSIAVNRSGSLVISNITIDGGLSFLGSDGTTVSLTNEGFQSFLQVIGTLDVYNGNADDFAVDLYGDAGLVYIIADSRFDAININSGLFQFSQGVVSANLPPCQSSPIYRNGSIQWDLTNEQLVYCDGLNWRVFKTAVDDGGVAASIAPVIFGDFVTTGVAALSADFSGYWNFAHDFVAIGNTITPKLAITCDAQSASGVGGTTGIVMKLISGAGNCTCNLGACNSISANSHNTCHCTTTGAVTDMAVEFDSTTDCATRPSGMFCKVYGSMSTP